jgi:hypothetical protein
MGGDELGFYSGSYRGFYSTLRGGTRRLTGGNGLDANGDVGRVLGANLGENGSYGRGATSIKLWT